MTTKARASHWAHLRTFLKANLEHLQGLFMPLIRPPVRGDYHPVTTRLPKLSNVFYHIQLQLLLKVIPGFLIRSVFSFLPFFSFHPVKPRLNSGYLSGLAASVFTFRATPQPHFLSLSHLSFSWHLCRGLLPGPTAPHEVVAMHCWWTNVPELVLSPSWPQYPSEWCGCTMFPGMFVTKRSSG